MPHQKIGSFVREGFSEKNCVRQTSHDHDCWQHIGNNQYMIKKLGWLELLVHHINLELI